MGPHNCPGVYLNILALASGVGGDPSKLPSPDTGKWLTPAEAHELAEGARRYAGTDDVADRYAKDMDGIFPAPSISAETVNNRQPEDPSYFKSESARETLKTWSMTIDDQFYNNVRAKNLHVPYLRCPTEVGWSLNVGGQWKNERENGPSSLIHGFINAWSHQALSAKSVELPTLHQFSLFRIWKNDDDLFQISKALASLLCSSSWTEGGMGCEEAGGTETSDIEPPLGAWETNADNVFLRPELEGILEQDRKLQHDRWVASKYLDPVKMAELEAEHREEELTLEELEAKSKRLDEEIADALKEQEEETRKQVDTPNENRETYQATMAMIKTVNASEKKEEDMIKDAFRRFEMKDKDVEPGDADMISPNPYLQRLEEEMAEWWADTSDAKSYVETELTESEWEETKKMFAEMEESKAATEGKRTSNFKDN